ncbi:MAG: hypothetical protein EA400_08025 [Chromatiaceae bacterium]|nr:MAG: hypothetical protein EA400_08025 [Chromatiaceae bacterium]
MNTQTSQPRIANDYIDIDLPLLPNTDNGEDVARLVFGILDDVANLTAGRATSHRDIVQALSIATAVRAAMAETASRSGQRIALDLLDVQIADARMN